MTVLLNKTIHIFIKKYMPDKVATKVCTSTELKLHSKPYFRKQNFLKKEDRRIPCLLQSPTLL